MITPVWLSDKDWGSEYQPFEYQKHLNTKNIWIPKTFEYQNHLNTKLFEIWYSNGLVFKWWVYVLCPVRISNGLLIKILVYAYRDNLSVKRSIPTMCFTHMGIISYKLTTNVSVTYKEYKQYSVDNTYYVCFVLWTRPNHFTPVHKKTKWRPFVRYSDGPAVWYKMAFEYWTIWHLTLFRP